MKLLSPILAALRVIFQNAFAYFAAMTAWVFDHLSWQVISWITALLFAFGFAMGRFDQLTTAIILFSSGIALLFLKFVSWTELREEKVPQRIGLIVLAVLVLGSAGISLAYWINTLRPVPPDIVAIQQPGQPNVRVLTLFNHKTTLQGVRIRVMEHVHRNDDASLRQQFESQYKDIGLVQPYTPIAIGTIELAQDLEDAFQINAMTPFGKFTYMLYFKRRPDNAWEERYVALHMAGDRVNKNP